MTDAFGATPLPLVSVDTQNVWYNPDDTLGQPQQPHAQQVAAFEAVPNDDCKNGSVLDVNQHFLVYAVKNGLLRVLHRASSVRSLLRGHSKKVTDISFFQNGDVLGTVGGNVIIWRIFFTSNEIHAEKLLEIPSMDTSRLIWHPFNPNQFWLLHTNETGINVATLVETTRITTTTTTTSESKDGASGAGHAICQLHNHKVVMDGAVLIANESNITDLCWSGKDTRHVMTCHENGTICLWNVKQLQDALPDGHVPATCISILQYSEPVTKCLFLPHDNIAFEENEEQGLTCAFMTASRNNSILTIWSSFYPNREPTKLQEFGMEQEVSDYNVDLCYGPAPSDGAPPAFFILLSHRMEGKVYTIHLSTIWSSSAPKRALAVGLDYVTPFSIKYPIYSWSIASVPAEHVSEEEESAIVGGLNFDLRFFAYQSKMVQQYTVPHYMCAAPTSPWSTSTAGVRVEPSTTKVPVDTVELMNTASYDEDYDLEEIEEDDDDDDEYEEAPLASALPTPDGLDTTPTAPTSSNPFANWLGAIAAKTTGTGASGNVPPPPTPVTTSTKAVIPSDLVETAPLPGEPAFLKPGELLSPGSMTDIGKAVEALSTAPTPQAAEPKKKKRDKSPKPNGGKKTQAQANTNPNPPKIAILKRGDEAPVAASESSTTPANVSSSDLEEVLTKTLAAHFKRQESFISDQVQKAVKSEMQTTVVPTLSKMMTQTMEQAVVKPVKAAIDKNAKERTKVQTDVIVSAVSGSVQEPLQNAFQQAMTTALVPAYEVATREMFLQVAASLEKGLAAGGSQSTDSTAAVQALSTKLETMSLTMESLTSEVEQLRLALSTSQGISPSGPGIPKTAPEPDAGQVVRDSILLSLKQSEYESAFTQALSASAADMAVYCCKNANVSDVLGGNSPAISQPILLCLMQQLGAVLVSSSDNDLQTILLWLQESALTLVPTDESIIRHVSQVLQQLVSSVEAKMALADPTLRRQLKMLLQVIQGMQR